MNRFIFTLSNLRKSQKINNKLRGKVEGNTFVRVSKVSRFQVSPIIK